MPPKENDRRTSGSQLTGQRRVNPLQYIAARAFAAFSRGFTAHLFWINFLPVTLPGKSYINTLTVNGEQHLPFRSKLRCFRFATRRECIFSGNRVTIFRLHDFWGVSKQNFTVTWWWRWYHDFGCGAAGAGGGWCVQVYLCTSIYVLALPKLWGWRACSSTSHQAFGVAWP